MADSSTRLNAPTTSQTSYTSSKPPVAAKTQPKFAIELSTSPFEHGWYGSMINTLGACVGTIGSIPICCCFPNPFKEVDQGYVGLVTKFGKFYKAADPGLVKINPFSEHLHRVDIRMQIAEIPQQIIMTKDNVNVQIDSVLYWHIIDPYQSEFGVSNVRHALIERTQTTLRHILGSKVLQDCIENREAIAQEIQNVTAPIAKTWGVKIESILIKDLSFTRELQESLSAAAQAKRVGESKVIAAKAEVDSAKLMREAADILNTPAAMQIRYLETMNTLAKAPNTRVIFLPSNSDKNPADTNANNVNNLLYANIAQ
ncbi:stomatin-like protein [Cunninghamella echinulata]|nr:stomatin-like protein [Cunninghamella echinulata]